ncbi:hypothetical protein SNE40_003083 [Patella caerulea]|uniref:phosphoinositide 5-phosphatase n=1 Tax=Patella caerulea TaxID=87958 RepID=A0AAN8Q0H1_PATCE
MAMGKIFRVFHKLPPDQDTPYSVILENKNQEDTLMFESNAIVVLTSSEGETVKKLYTKVLDAYGCLGVLNLNGGNQTILYMVLVTSCISVGKIGETEVFKITAVHLLSLRNEPSDEDRVVEVKKLLSSGTFYFSWSTHGSPWDLSLCAQRKQQDQESDNRFFWNRLLHVHFRRYGIQCEQWLLKIMCGAVEIRTIYASHRQAKACLISRLSCERAGTRFNVRGTNDDGHVANFVETEQVIFLDDQVSSYVQTRGSVPLFWEQPGINVGAHKVHMSRGYEASAPAYDRHIQMICKQYGEQVIVNLLGSKEGERMLSQAFQNHHMASSHKDKVPFFHFDYHSEIKGSNLKNLEKLRAKLQTYLTEFGFYCGDATHIIKKQSGTIRTNCLDCLDRTNAVQAMLAMEILASQIKSLGLDNKPQMLSRFQEVYKQIWGLNGDHVSRIYAGTGALGGGRSKYSDAARSATRAIQNNFLDNSKQEAIDIMLLGDTLLGELTDKARALLTARSLHASSDIIQAMVTRYKEYTVPVKLRIGVCTWNVNGGKHFRSIAYKHQSLADWLLDAYKTVAMSRPGDIDDDIDYTTPTDIYAIGFQEIVDLNASNIMKASTTNAQEWQKELMKTISRDHKYVVLTSIQLVGVVLYVFIRPHLAPYIRDVAVEKVKTGFGGATGNKGGVAIRFLMHTTSICFVCAHLAAGQSQVNDRNADYTEIMRRMSFPMDRSIQSHDYVFWCGDFNYRIDMTGDEVKECVRNNELEPLQECDQLNKEREQGRTFQGFKEAKTNFPPTYKYDLFSDDYDTSEKCRAPAWTDRVLWRRRNVLPEQDGEDHSEDSDKPILYTRAELRTSDHRPVIAMFDIEVLAAEEEMKANVLQEVISQQGPPDGTVIISMATGTSITDEIVDEIVAIFNEVGEIIVVRFVGEEMWIIYRRGRCALEALQYDQKMISAGVISVRLRTEDWKAVIEEEMKLCSENTEAMCDMFTYSLLGDDFDVPSEEFSMEVVDDDDEYSSENLTVSNAVSSRSNTPLSGRSSPARSDDGLSDFKGRPPTQQQLNNRLSSQIALPVTDSSQNNLVSSSSEIVRKEPPARPCTQPTKPPAPQRPPGGPPTSAPGLPSRPGYTPNINKPLRPQPSAKMKKAQQVTSIGLPMGAMHQGHASNEAEARNLIEKLMSGTNIKPKQISMYGKPTTAYMGLPDQKPMVRSKTDENIDDRNLTDTIRIPVPKQRFRSMEKLTSDSQPLNSTAPFHISESCLIPRRSSTHNQEEKNTFIHSLDTPVSLDRESQVDPFDTSAIPTHYMNKLPPPIPVRTVLQQDNPIHSTDNVKPLSPHHSCPDMSPPAIPEAPCPKPRFHNSEKQSKFSTLPDEHPCASESKQTKPGPPPIPSRPGYP